MTTATTPLGQREEEARRIARDKGFAIVNASPDWTGFTLDDGVEVDGRTYSTVYNWINGRFEGMVTA